MRSPFSRGRFLRSRIVRFLAVALVALLSAAGPLADPAGPIGVSVEYRPPADAPIVDHFRPPPERWMAGNRGIDYGTGPGEPIRASADGRVVFAGSVGAALHVTIEHADRLRTSYSFVDVVLVESGMRVRGGDVIALAGGPFHFGVRTPDGTYLDPEALLAGTLHPQVRLVPGTDQGLEALGASERRSCSTYSSTTGSPLSRPRPRGTHGRPFWSRIIWSSSIRRSMPHGRWRSSNGGCGYASRAHRPTSRFRRIDLDASRCW